MPYMTSVSLDTLGWNASLTQVFDKCKNAIGKRVTFAHGKKSKVLFIPTNASDTNWSVSSLTSGSPTLSHHILTNHMSHSSPILIASLLPSFGWPTVKKKLYAVLAFVKSSHWLAAWAALFDFDIDHKNVVVIFEPTSITPGIRE